MRLGVAPKTNMPPALDFQLNRSGRKMVNEVQMLELTQEQQREIQHAGDNPLRLTDPRTQTEYVVVKLDLYQKMRRVFEEVDPSFFEFEEIVSPTP